MHLQKPIITWQLQNERKKHPSCSKWKRCLQDLTWLFLRYELLNIQNSQIIICDLNEKKTGGSKEKEWNKPIERAWIELERSTWLISWFFGTRTEYSMTITMCNGRYTPWYPYVCAPPSHKVIHVIKIILTRLCPRLLPRTYSPFQRVYIILLIFPMISNRSWWLCKLAAPKNKTNKN